MFASSWWNLCWGKCRTVISTGLQMVTKFAEVQKCLTHWMKTKKKENMTLDEKLLILANI